MGFFSKLKQKFSSSKVSSKITEATKTKEETTTYFKKQDKVFTSSEKIDNYVAGFDKSSKSITQKIASAFKAKPQVDSSLVTKIEEILIASDLGINLTTKIIKEINKEITNQNIKDFELLKEVIVDKIFVIYSNMSFIKTSIDLPAKELKVILISGINGSGKTTTIAKMAHKFKLQEKKVMVVAADTFRAAAVEQLELWAHKAGVKCFKGKKEGQDPASVVFDALDHALGDKYNVMIVDTAGRLENKINLMQELQKIKSVITKKIPLKNTETILVIDAINGQNVLSQAQEFHNSINVDSIIVTKIDGTSKGGTILNIKDQLNIPVKFIGFGEKMEDLQEFDVEKYIFGLFAEWFNER